MPIDEIVFAVSCSATVNDEFELQLTKTGLTKHESEWQWFKIDRPKTKLKRAFAHSRVSGTKLKTHFLKLNEEMRKWAGKPITEIINISCPKIGRPVSVWNCNYAIIWNNVPCFDHHNDYRNWKLQRILWHRGATDRRGNNSPSHPNH